MKILVTGGAGFIGSHIADGFINEGHEVIVVDNLSTGKKENINPQAKFYLMDIRSEKLEKVFKEEMVDIVCHQAAQMDIRKSVADPVYDADVNILGTLNILQNCISHRVKKILFASTGGAVYGEQEVFPCNENHPVRPISPYGVTKLSVEKYLFFYGIEYGLKYVILRYANVYGPRQNPSGEAGVVAVFTSKLIAVEQPVINGDGKQTRDYVFVGDVVQANLKSLSFNGDEIFNIGTGIETDVNQIFKILNKLTGAKSQEKHGPPKKGEQRRSVIDYQKANRLLDWNPEIRLEEGLNRTVAFFRINPQSKG
ncbi:NAD-dependent epimerase/dehydratase family protein [bacterium]|nr:NAD-dependent epimerase/dehydratase family protein [bacterium]